MIISRSDDNERMRMMHEVLNMILNVSGNESFVHATSSIS